MSRGLASLSNFSGAWVSVGCPYLFGTWPWGDLGQPGNTDLVCGG